MCEGASGLSLGQVNHRGVDDVLQVLADVTLSRVRQLLDDFEAVEEASVRRHLRLPLRDLNRVVCDTAASLSTTGVYLLL